MFASCSMAHSGPCLGNECAFIEKRSGAGRGPAPEMFGRGKTSISAGRIVPLQRPPYKIECCENVSPINTIDKGYSARYVGCLYLGIFLATIALKSSLCEPSQISVRPALAGAGGLHAGRDLFLISSRPGAPYLVGFETLRLRSGQATGPTNRCGYSAPICDLVRRGGRNPKTKAAFRRPLTTSN